MTPYVSLTFGGPRSGRPPGAEEIAATIADQIHRAGPALAGCRLPPIRVLAHRLGISKNTVSSAYDELKARGLLESRATRGLYIAAQGQPHPATLAMPRVPAIRFAPAPALSSAKPVKGGPLQLGSVFIDPRLLPRAKLDACFRSALKRPGLSDFSVAQGFPPLRHAIAARLRQRGIDADPDHIITTVGSQQVLDLVSHALGANVIATENPAYALGKTLLQANGAELLGLPIDPFAGADLERWESSLRGRRPALAYLTTHFQNPTGYSYTSAEMASILAWSREFGFGILEDDWGSDMLSHSEFGPSLRTLGGGEVLYMNSFTKKLLPSLRIGYVLASESTLAPLLARKRCSIGSSPALGEAALYEFLERGYYDAHLRTLQQELDLRYRHCLDALRERMPEGVRWTAPGGGPVLWVECPREVSLPTLAARAAQRDVLLPSSDGAFFGAPHLHGFKLGYACLTPQEMQRGLEVVASELQRQLGATSRQPAKLAARVQAR